MSREPLAPSKTGVVLPHEAAKRFLAAAWTRLTVRDGEKGPVDVEMITRRVQTRLERKRTGPAEWLVVTRRPLADDSTSEGQWSPNATEQDGRYRYRY